MEQYQFQTEQLRDFVFPSELRNRNGKVEITLTIFPEPKTQKNFPEPFIPTKGYKFSREEANER
ncbi:MAG: hypothetical protein FWB76_03590 [Oscillospiraceae bacterium]|nr:hypothetical protein [Oscillospiraceae bacterium]